MRREPPLCCGSAGTYSVLQPELATALRDRKLANLAATEPTAIVSANIGCITHLQSGTATPVLHWIELIANRALPSDRSGFGLFPGEVDSARTRSRSRGPKRSRIPTVLEPLADAGMIAAIAILARLPARWARR